MAPAAAGAGGIALAASLASSAFMPFGLAGRVEPDPGLRFDGLVMVAGAVLTGVAVLATMAVAAIGVATARRDAATRHLPGRLSRLLGQAPSAHTSYGLHLALGRGRSGSRAANRLGITGVVLAAAAGIASLVLVASVDHVFSTPAAYGWTWDYVVPDQTAAGLADDPGVESVAVVTAGPITFDGRPLLTRGIESLKGEPPVLLVAGRHAGPGEVVLGARTMADLGVGIGDSVVAEGTRERRELQVVGEAVLAGVVDVPEAGWGAAMPLSEFEALGSEDEVTSGIIALADGADRGAFAERLTAELGEPPQMVEEPVELARLREIEAFPRVLALFLAIVGLVSATYAIVVTARQHRGELAVLRALGMGRRGVYLALSVQAGVLALFGIGLGVPLGIAAGQAVWRNVAGSLGVVVTVVMPWTTIIAASVAACVIVAALAFLPARGATQLRPAVALRAELPRRVAPAAS
jgi:hypothetical protein